MLCVDPSVMRPSSVCAPPAPPPPAPICVLAKSMDESMRRAMPKSPSFTMPEDVRNTLPACPLTCHAPVSPSNQHIGRHRLTVIIMVGPAGPPPP